MPQYIMDIQEKNNYGSNRLPKNCYMNLLLQ